MQTKVFIGKVFGHEGVFEAFEDQRSLYIIEGKFLEKTWGNDHYQMKELHGKRVLAVAKDNFTRFKKTSKLLSELF